MWCLWLLTAKELCISAFFGCLANVHARVFRIPGAVGVCAYTIIRPLTCNHATSERARNLPAHLILHSHDANPPTLPHTRAHAHSYCNKTCQTAHYEPLHKAKCRRRQPRTPTPKKVSGGSASDSSLPLVPFLGVDGVD